MQLEDLNTQLGENVALHEKKVRKNNELRAKHISMGQKVLSNTFSRFFYVKSTRAFEQWKDAVKFLKHRDALIQKMLDRWRHYRFYAVKAVFQNFVQQSRINDTKAALAHKNMEVDE